MGACPPVPLHHERGRGVARLRWRRAGYRAQQRDEAAHDDHEHEHFQRIGRVRCQNKAERKDQEDDVTEEQELLDRILVDERKRLDVLGRRSRDDVHQDGSHDGDDLA